jgi:hypothetical protein
MLGRSLPPLGREGNTNIVTNCFNVELGGGGEYEWFFSGAGCAPDE